MSEYSINTQQQQPGVQTLGNTAEAYASTNQLGAQAPNNQDNGFIEFSVANIRAIAAGQELGRNVQVRRSGDNQISYPIGNAVRTAVRQQQQQLAVRNLFQVPPCMAQQQNPPSPPHNHNNNQTPPGGGRTRGGQFHRGQQVEAKWSGDNRWHLATITLDNRDDELTNHINIDTIGA